MCAVLAAGCAGLGASKSTPAPSGTEPALPSADAAPRAASIPALEIVVASSLRKGVKAKRGTTLAAGSYKPALTGERITSVQWVVGEAEGLRRLMLSLQFDEKGTRDFANLIEANADKDLLLVLNRKVVGNLAIYESVSPGAVTLGSQQVLDSRSQIDSATVPSK